MFFAADKTSPVFEDLAGCFARRRSGVLRAALAPISERIRVAFVYGSMASGDATGRSDVDVLVLRDVGFAEVVRVLGALHSVRRREVNPVVMKPADFGRKRRARDSFVTSLLRQPKIWLIGNESDLAKLGKDRAA